MDHDHHNHHTHMIEDFKRRLKISVPLTIPILILSPIVQQLLGIEQFINIPFQNFINLFLSSIVFFYGGWPFLIGLRDELKDKNPGMMTLIGIAISVAYLFSIAVTLGFPGEVLYWELATLIDIMLLGHWIEMRSVMGASRALEELAKIMPAKAHKIMRAGKIDDVDIEGLQVGDLVLIRPGEKAPVDGIIIDGTSSMNESLVTGESKPVEKNIKDKVIGGAVNGEGSLTVKVEKLGKDSYLAQVIELVRSAQESKSKTQNLADRAAKYLTAVAVSVGLLTFVAWSLFADQSLSFAIQRTVAVMVIACPHALGVAIPLVVSISTAQTAQRGLLIRNRTAFEKARNITAVIFDKTGTLTKGEFGVTDVVSLSGESREKILQVAASLEAHSQHPIGKAIAKAVNTTKKVSNFRSLTGRGVEGIVDGQKIRVVSPGFLTENNIKTDNKKIKQIAKDGKTVVYVLREKTPLGIIALEDVIRKESKKALQTLKQKNIKTIMLTGDGEEVAASVARRIGIDEYFAQVLPDEKSKKVKEVQKRGEVVAMVGDGINDAPALAQADVGIAIGAGTDVAIEAADIVLVKNNPQDAVRVITFAKKTYDKMVQNLFWATGYNIVAIPLAAGVLYSTGILLTPAAGAILMSLSTVIVAANAKRLKLY